MTIQDFFIQKYKDWGELEKIIEKIESTKLKGDVFEYLVYFFFNYYKELYQIQEIYCPVVDGRTFPQPILEKLKLEHKDFGVDGIYINRDGKYVAWQAKFRSDRVSPTFSELATFWAEAENADFRLIVSNSIYLPKVSKKKQGHLSILFDQFSKLTDDFFEQLSLFYSDSDSSEIIIKRKYPRDYQEKIISDILKGFQTSTKGKLIAACGIGKTLISLWTMESINAKKVVFFAPSLQLVRQTLEQWVIESKEPFRYLCICSDQTINSFIDSNNIDLSDIDVPVTTEVETISQFLINESSLKSVIFCTYQSSLVLHEAIKKSGFKGFDFTIYDEAHRTAGLSNSNLFSAAVGDDIIPSSKKLFMTATERLVRPNLSKQLQDNGRTVFSMNDRSQYGEVFHRLTFGEAISKKIISDYRIVFSGISKDNLRQLLKQNRIVTTDSTLPDPESIEHLYKRKILERVLQDYDVRKAITFHSKISEAKKFADELNPISDIHQRKCISHINGAMSIQERAVIINEFEESELGILTNVRCLTEGVDIPLIDAVFFADPKGSLVDIVQAVGRALRQPYGQSGKLAYIIIPLLVDSGEGSIVSGQGFEALFNLIQALRDQDEKLAEWIDGINLGAAKGRVSKGSSLGKIIINIPTEIEYDEFADSLILKIAEVNKNPTGTTGVGSKLGKNERKGSFDRLFKTLCDYTPERLEEGLVKPTFKLISDLDSKYTYSQLKINNNNVSHCQRLGLIIKESNPNFLVTTIGRKYSHSPESFISIFKNQMMLFKYDYEFGPLYPYRLAFEYMKTIKEMNFIQFVYGLYSIQQTLDGNCDIESAINISMIINQEFPNIELTNETNKIGILEELNKFHPIGYSYENVWTDRTTTGNQYRYLIRHLELFDDIFYFSEGKLRIFENSDEAIETILKSTEEIIENPDYGNQWWID